VQHDDVVRIVDAGEHDGLLYIVTDLVPGSSLNRVIRAIQQACRPHRAPTVDDLLAASGAGAGDGAAPDWSGARSYGHAVAAVVLDMLRALEAVHARGLLHRDLKPANVMLTPEGRAKLLDFGLAAIADRHAGITSWLAGTPGYLAPEQLQDARTGSDPRTDVYQAGLILYEASCLRPAFPALAAGPSFDDIRSGRCPRPRAVAPWLQPDLEDICLRAIEPAVDRRYQDAASFRRDLELWLHGAVPRAARGGGPGRMLRQARAGIRRHKVRCTIAASALLGAVGAAVVLFPREPRAAIVAYDPQSGHATLHLSHSSTILLLLVARAPNGDAPQYLTPVQLASEGEPPAWSRLLPAGTVEVRVVAPAVADDPQLTWSLCALACAPDEREAAASAWAALAANQPGPEAPASTTAQAALVLEATAGRHAGGGLAAELAQRLRRLRFDG
jgi:hypothetical protein